MPRIARQECTEHAQHITVRALDGRWVVIRRNDADEYRERLMEVARKYGWVILAFNVLGNHVHFIVWTPRANLGRGMKELQEGFARWANERDGVLGRGHFWAERYDNRILETRRRFVACLRYVTRNAVRHGLVSTVEQWPHSSYHAMVAQAPAPSWLAREAVLEVVGGARAFHAAMACDDVALVEGLCRAFGEEEGVRQAIDDHGINHTVVAAVLACSLPTLRRRLAAGRRAAPSDAPLRWPDCAPSLIRK